jgi:hypothetical protein
MHFIRVKAFWNNVGMKLMDMSKTSLFPMQFGVYAICTIIYIHYIVYVTLYIFITNMDTNCMCIWTCTNNTKKMFNTT